MSSCIDVVTWVEVRVEEGLLDTLAEEVVLVLLPRRAYECQRIGNCSTGGVTSDDRPRVCHWWCHQCSWAVTSTPTVTRTALSVAISIEVEWMGVILVFTNEGFDVGRATEGNLRWWYHSWWRRDALALSPSWSSMVGAAQLTILDKVSKLHQAVLLNLARVCGMREHLLHELWPAGRKVWFLDIIVKTTRRPLVR